MNFSVVFLWIAMPRLTFQHATYIPRISENALTKNLCLTYINTCALNRPLVDTSLTQIDGWSSIHRIPIRF